MHPFIEKVNALAVAIGNSIQLRGFKTGGTVGQVPTKNSNTDFDWGWGTPVVAGSMTQAEITGAITNKVTFASDNGLQVAGSYVTLTGVEALTNKTFSNCTFPTFNQNTTGNAATVSGLSFSAGKTLTVSNSLTLAGTDGSTLNFGTGGTLGTAAFTNSNAYATAAQGTDERVPSLIGLSSKFSTEDAAVLDNDRIAIFDSNDTFAPKHALFSTLWTWIKSKLSQISGTFSVGGAWAFTHTLARPTSAGTPTLASDSLITRADGDGRYASPLSITHTNGATSAWGLVATGLSIFATGRPDATVVCSTFSSSPPDVRFAPIWVPCDRVVTQATIKLIANTHVSNTIRGALYTTGSNGMPDVRVGNQWDWPCGSTGPITVSTGSLSLTKGLYWLALQNSVGATAWGANPTFLGFGVGQLALTGVLFGLPVTGWDIYSNGGGPTSYGGTSLPSLGADFASKGFIFIGNTGMPAVLLK